MYLMVYISAYEYVVGEAKMTMIFAVYLQPLVSKVTRRKMLSSAALNSSLDMVSFCRTPLMILFLLLSLCMWTVIELLV